MNFYQDVFFRVLDFARGRRTIDRLHFLRSSQHWSPEALKKWQLDRLNELLAEARKNSKYHAKALADVNLPLQSLDALSELPILAKAAIRENFEGLKNSSLPPARFIKNRTGGSTGEPMFYCWDKRGQDWNRASVYRSAEWAGVALGEKTVTMSGSHFDYSQGQTLFSRFIYFLQRYRDFPVAYLDDELLERYFLELLEFRPTSIWGYASGIHAFANYIERKHAGTNFDFLRALVTSSETLRPEQRETINRVFGSGKVHDNYGSREIYIGGECRAHNGYHLHGEVVIVEIVDKNNRPCPAGTPGRVLITDLSNLAFPFIRYEIGDVASLAAPGTCSCGLSLPRLQSLEGRIADVIVLRDRILTAPNVTIIMSDFRGVKSYQIRQDSIDELKILVVPDSDYNETFSEYILGAMRKMVDGQATVTLQLVDDIPLPESGKRRYIISTVSKDHI
ncbi:MAG: hypothetical protein ABI905_09130 [Betaproteobacteria bacterium]